MSTTVFTTSAGSCTHISRSVSAYDRTKQAGQSFPVGCDRRLRMPRNEQWDRATTAIATDPEAQSICSVIVNLDDFGWESLESMRVVLVSGIAGLTGHDLTSTENNNQREHNQEKETLNVSKTKTENE